MIFRSARCALVLGVVFFGACQTGFYQTSTPMRVATTPMDGVWASTDGVFVASFGRGSFTSRFTATNEILAQGTYSVVGPSVSMQWISVATQQQRTANCSFMAADTVACNQGDGGRFELKRSGFAAPMASG